MSQQFFLFFRIVVIRHQKNGGTGWITGIQYCQLIGEKVLQFLSLQRILQDFCKKGAVGITEISILRIKIFQFRMQWILQIGSPVARRIFRFDKQGMESLAAFLLNIVAALRSQNEETLLPGQVKHIDIAVHFMFFLKDISQSEI